MKLSIIDEQEVRTFARSNLATLEYVISPDAKAAHAEENFLGEVLTIHLFLGFAKSLAEILGAAVTVTKVISSAQTLFTWAREHITGKKTPSEIEPPLSERLLVLLFEAYANRNSGLSEESLHFLLNAETGAISDALKALENQKVVRQSRDGSWRYRSPA